MTTPEPMPLGRLAAIRERIGAASPAPWYPSGEWLVAGVAFDDEYRHASADTATTCCYCHGPIKTEIAWSGPGLIHDRETTVHWHRAPERSDRPAITSGEDDGRLALDDVRFLVHARTDVPALLAEVDRLHAGCGPC